MLDCYYCGAAIRSPFGAMIFKRRRFHLAHRVCRQQRVIEKRSEHASKMPPLDAVADGKSADEERFAVGHIEPVMPLRTEVQANGEKAADGITVDHLAASLARLEKLSQAIFPKAVKGDLAAVGLAVEIEKSRAQLLELDLRKRQSDSEHERVAQDLSAVPGIYSDSRSASSEDHSRRERATLSRIPKIK
jgi:hypothetical protein